MYRMHPMHVYLRTHPHLFLPRHSLSHTTPLHPHLNEVRGVLARDERVLACRLEISACKERKEKEKESGRTWTRCVGMRRTGSMPFLSASGLSNSFPPHAVSSLALSNAPQLQRKRAREGKKCVEKSEEGRRRVVVVRRMRASRQSARTLRSLGLKRFYVPRVANDIYDGRPKGVTGEADVGVRTALARDCVARQLPHGAVKRAARGDGQARVEGSGELGVVVHAGPADACTAARRAEREGKSERGTMDGE